MPRNEGTARNSGWPRTGPVAPLPPLSALSVGSMPSAGFSRQRAEILSLCHCPGPGKQYGAPLHCQFFGYIASYSSHRPRKPYRPRKGRCLPHLFHSHPVLRPFTRWRLRRRPFPPRKRGSRQRPSTEKTTFCLNLACRAKLLIPASAKYTLHHCMEYRFEPTESRL